MPLIPHKGWLSTATLACLPTRPLRVRLQTEHTLPEGRSPSLRLNLSPSSASSRTPSRAGNRPSLLTRMASPLRQAIQTP